MGKKQNETQNGKLLSVIVPMYNAEKYINKCLDSLLVPKDIMAELEVLVIDDGSKDQGAECAEAYQRKYPDSFFVIRKQNGGHGSAIDQGVMHCSGKYFKVLDADDWVHTIALVQILQKLKGIDAQVIACGYDRYHILSGKTTQIRPYHKTADKAHAVCWLSMQRLIREWDRYSRLFCLHGLIYHTGFYRTLAYRLPRKVYYDDAFFFTVPCSHADKMAIIDTQLYVYRTGDVKQSVSARNREAGLGQLGMVIDAVIQTKGRNAAKSEAGREYWYRKLVSVAVDYYVTAYLRCRDREAGRRAAKVFTQKIYEADLKLYRRLFIRRLLLYGMSLRHKHEEDFERLINLMDFLRR